MGPFSLATARRRALATTLGLVVGVTASAGAAPLASRGRLEREAVEAALDERGLVIDPNPEGKVIGRVHVVNQDVFSRQDWHFQRLNFFHRTTRPDTLERELLLRPGQLWDPAIANESVRNLQAPPPLFFANGTRFAAPQIVSVVEVVPVASPQPGTVDVLAVTRDLWSLRLNTDFAFQKDTLSMFTTSLSENNLFGWRKFLAAGFQLDQGRYGLGPTYFDPNLAGTRLTLLAMGTAWYGRDTSDYEGNSEVFSLRYPLYSLASTWGARFDFHHDDVVERHFCDNQLCQIPVAGALAPYAFHRRVLGLDVGVVRSFGQDVIQRLHAGYRVNRRRAQIGSDVATALPNPDQATEFLHQWAPLPEVRSEPYLRYELFTARYGVYRDLETFDLRESRRLGPLLAVEVAAGLTALGADFTAYPISATASWAAAPLGSGFALAQVQGSARFRSGQLIDQRTTSVLFFASPTIANTGRVVVSAMTDRIHADTNRTRLFLGGDAGLRGYDIGEFQGTVGVAAHAELRTVPLEVHSQRFGAVLFYDVGHAAERYRDLHPHHDVGVGFRWLIPQLNSSVLRIDWAVPTQSGPYSHPGLPGRITAGFMQSFWLLDSPSGYVPSY